MSACVTFRSVESENVSSAVKCSTCLVLGRWGSGVLAELLCCLLFPKTALLRMLRVNQNG